MHELFITGNKEEIIPCVLIGKSKIYKSKDCLTKYMTNIKSVTINCWGDQMLIKPEITPRPSESDYSDVLR